MLTRSICSILNHSSDIQDDAMDGWLGHVSYEQHEDKTCIGSSGRGCVMMHSLQEQRYCSVCKLMSSESWSSLLESHPEIQEQADTKLEPRSLPTKTEERGVHL